MAFHSTTKRSQAIIVILLCLPIGFSALGAAEDPPNPPADAITPVRKVTATPSADKTEPGKIEFKAEIDTKQVVIPRGPKKVDNFTLVGQNLTRTVKLESAQLENWEKKYVAAVEKATKDKKNLIATKGREVFRFPAIAPGRKAVGLVAGQAQQLVDFQGLPELDPAEEALLIQNCLMITDLKVVNDARATGNGPWSFGFLMSQIANPTETGLSATDFVRDWLSNWERDQTINGFVAKNRRNGIRSLIIDPWPKLPTGEIDLTKAPFRLLAISNRFDLRSNKVLGFDRVGQGGAGEARFVFCAVNLNDKDSLGNPKPLPFTVIFEYAIKRDDAGAVIDWAQQWYQLRNLALGTPMYNDALQRITDQFALAGADPECPPNRSAIGQLRTNEIALAQPWDLREFRPDTNNTGELKQVTVKQNPDNTAFNGFDIGTPPGPLANDFARYVNDDTDDIINSRHRTPLHFPQGQNFIGASALTPPNVFWKAPGIVNPEARHLFSLGTCNACHAREAFPEVGTPQEPFDNVADPTLANRQPPHFTHVRPRLADKEAQLSAFLTGKNPMGRPYELADPTGQIDPVTKKVKLRKFGDLPFRAADLKGISEYGTYYELYRRPSQRVH